MTEICKTCHKEFDSGIWISPQFKDERVLLFCSDKCKKGYIEKKLNKIKVEYPKYYDKIMNSSKEKGFWDLNLRDIKEKLEKNKSQKTKVYK